MRSEAQIEASRINGAKSRGPITPEGKAVSSQNARKTADMESMIALVCLDDPEEYNRAREGCYLEIEPRDEPERQITEIIFKSRWRIHQLDETLTYLMSKGAFDLQNKAERIQFAMGAKYIPNYQIAIAREHRIIRAERAEIRLHRKELREERKEKQQENLQIESPSRNVLDYMPSEDEDAPDPDKIAKIFDEAEKKGKLTRIQFGDPPFLIDEPEINEIEPDDKDENLPSIEEDGKPIEEETSEKSRIEPNPERLLGFNETTDPAEIEEIIMEAEMRNLRPVKMGTCTVFLEEEEFRKVLMEVGNEPNPRNH